MGTSANKGQHRPGRHRESQPPSESKTHPRERGQAVGRAPVPREARAVKGLIAAALDRLGKKS